MKKIALIGVENSHAPAFARLIQNNPEKYGDMEIIGVYSYDGAAADQMVADGLAPMAARTPTYFLDQADAVINTARHGDNHYEYSMPYIRAGIPMFIDKPFCITWRNAWEMITEAKKNGALLSGGSSLRFAPEMLELKKKVDAGEIGRVTSASLSAPVNMVNPYGNFFFYAGHLVHMLLTMFGLPESVYAIGHEKTVTVLCRYGSMEAVLHYTVGYQYTITVYGETENRYVTLTPRDEPLLDEFCNMIRSGTMAQSYADLAAPVALMEAIYLSYQTGVEQTVKPFI